MLLEEGATPAQVDSAIEEFGFAMGPFRMGDLAGLRHRLGDPQAPLRGDPRGYRCVEMADALCELGRFGQKTGGGWYDYEAGRRDAMPAPDGRGACWRHSHRERGIDAAQDRPTTEIVERLVYALVNEGARMLEEGIALRASRHRRGVPHRLRLPACARRPDVLRRPGGSRRGAVRIAALPRTVLGAGTATRASGRRGRELRLGLTRSGATAAAAATRF